MDSKSTYHTTSPTTPHCLWFIVSLDNFFHSYGEVIIIGEGLRILTYARHSWPFRSQSSLEMEKDHIGNARCLFLINYVHNKTILRMKKVLTVTRYISEDHCHSHLMPSVSKESCHYLYLTTQICRGWNSNTQPFACGANALTHRRLLLMSSDFCIFYSRICIDHAIHTETRVLIPMTVGSESLLCPYNTIISTSYRIHTV